MKLFNWRLSVYGPILSGLFVAAAETTSLAGNLPPQVSIVWPHAGDWWDNSFSVGTIVKIKADAVDPDGSITQVRFYVSTNLIGVATNPPFNIVWFADNERGEARHLKAMAEDNLGASSESSPVRIYTYNGAPPTPVVEMISPLDGSMFPAPGTFSFVAEVLASIGDNGPIEFFIGTNSVGLVNQSGLLTATSPPATITVTNLAEGDHYLKVQYRGAEGSICVACYVLTNHIRVVRLGAQVLPQRPGEGFRFEVLTSFPDRPTVIERSPNLHDWSPISTNSPSTNRFIFTDPVEPGITQRFYRVVLPPE